MRRSSVTWAGHGAAIPDVETSGVDTLVVHIGKLLRHPAFRRDSVVSPLLLRHLPYDAAYDWSGEAALRARLAAAGLDAASLDHLIRNVQAEVLRLRRPADV
ncbi:hypothetical protein [Methylobacterium sp. J-070]|uniref:hypothetical protein n=1 Tax=Methylobacterium sp. J-070 TaxID=2836650 RepID=UPI001FBA1D45|nr:hypothetical protein [Methylobacterium sp. J-070]MCJ2048154.1 hypothetical protein [Methylobacterium sp. J-070]